MLARVPHTPALLPIAVRVAAPATLPELGPELGLTWRALSEDDAVELTRLLNAVEEADRLPYRTAVEETLEKFEGDWKDIEHDTLAGVDSTGALRAWAQIVQPPGDTRVVRAFLDGGVDPAWQQRGIGRAVLAWSIARARQVLAATGKELPARIGAYVPETAARLEALVKAAGLTPQRYYADLRRSLSEPLPGLPAMPGISIVPWSEELDDRVRLAHNDAFASHWGSEPRSAEDWAHGRSMFAPTWSFVAIDDASGEVAGYLVSGRYEQDWALNGFSAGYVELLGVRPAWRGRGLATALLVTAMQAYVADGIDNAELGVDTENLSGALRLYTGLGFSRFHSAALWSLEL